MSNCEVRNLGAPEFVDNPVDAAQILLDGVREHVLQELGGANPDSAGYSLLGKLNEALVVTEDGIALGEGLNKKEVVALGISAPSAFEAIECSGCDYATVCQVGEIATATRTAVEQYLEDEPILDIMSRSPEWLLGMWSSRSQEGGSLTQHVALPTGIQFLDTSQVNSSSTLSLQESITKDKGLRPKIVMPVTSFKIPGYTLNITDARAAITANNAQNPHPDDVNDMLWKLLNRATAVIKKQNGLLRGEQDFSSNYKTLDNYTGNGILTEVKIDGKGSKSRLYGIVEHDKAKSIIAYTLLGASSGNGNTAQNKFLAGIGCKPGN